LYSRFSIQTRLSTADAEATLARLVGSRRDGSPATPFVGRVSGGTFKFHRLFIGRNDFIPIVSGRIVQGEGGAVVRGTMRLHLAVAAFEIGMIWLAVSVAVLVLRNGAANLDAIAVVFALAFPLFAIFLMSIAYFPERRRAMRLLGDAFRGR
jgi:LytS/YehU family sensor histidine kinase